MLKLGNSLTAERDKKHITLYKNGGLLKRVDIRQATTRRLFIVELVNDLGVSKDDVADALAISRQTVYNTLDTYEHFGVDGLLHSEKRGTGNPALRDTNSDANPVSGITASVTRMVKPHCR